jgi:hypothetical protein
MNTVFSRIVCLIFLLTSTTPQSLSTQVRGRGSNAPEAVPIVISPDGFPRTSLSLPQGSYAFVVFNHTGFRDLTVYLERMPGAGVTGTPSQQEFKDQVRTSKARLVRNVQLVPGTYRLRVENRPSWVCAIQVN